MKKTLLILFCLGLLWPLLAKDDSDDWIFAPAPNKTNEQKSQENDELIKVNFQKKDARLAMLFSALLPGAGQFYADKSAITTWIFPILEAGIIGSIVYFNMQGDRRTDDFEKYANGENAKLSFRYTINDTEYSLDYDGPRYNRSFQAKTEAVLRDFYPHDIYDQNFFRLDDMNTQHFYEDIGKYNKYIFGWADWYYNFAVDPRDGSFAFENDDFNDAWIWADTQYEHSRIWTANVRIEDFLSGFGETHHIAPSTLIASPSRQKYIQMRKDANASYSNGRIATLALAFNHIAASINAYVLTNKVNKTYLTQAPALQFKYFTALKDGRVQPSLGLNWNF